MLPRIRRKLTAVLAVMADRTPFALTFADGETACTLSPHMLTHLLIATLY